MEHSESYGRILSDLLKKSVKNYRQSSGRCSIGEAMFFVEDFPIISLKLQKSPNPNDILFEAYDPNRKVFLGNTVWDGYNRRKGFAILSFYSSSIRTFEDYFISENGLIDVISSPEDFVREYHFGSELSCRFRPPPNKLSSAVVDCFQEPAGDRDSSVLDDVSAERLEETLREQGRLL